VTGVDIVVAGAEDLPAVMTVMSAAFDPRFGEAWTAPQCLGLLTLPGTRLLIARDSDPLGFALARTIAGDCELMMLGVVPRARNRGIGRRLLDQVIEHANAHDAAAVFLEVRAGNPAIHLYVAAEFTKVGERRRYYRGNKGEVFDAETYRLALT